MSVSPKSPKSAHVPATTANPTEASMSKSTSTSTSLESNPSAPATRTLFQKPPPSNALIPTPPDGFIPSGDSFAGVTPRLAELGALQGAVEDLQAFVDYATVLGSTAPPRDEVVAAFTLANQWSTMRKASLLWDKFAQMQEGIAWTTLRPLMEKLAPAFALASSHNASLPTKFANLTTLLNAKKVISKKGASTRALNKRAVAEGKPPIHGKVGRQRKKASDKAIVAAAGSPAAPPPAPAPVAGAPSPAPSTVTAPTPELARAVTPPATPVHT